VLVARVATVGLIVLALFVSLWLNNALQAFRILLQIGAGTGLIFLLRWFWWRINAWSEISGMVISFSVAVYLEFIHPALGFTPIDASLALVVGVAITTVGWLTVTLLTAPTSLATLQSFYDRIRPCPAGWRKVVDVSGATEASGEISAAFACWGLGCLVVYGALFGTGYVLYGRPLPALIAFSITAAGTVGLFRVLPRVGFD
jgi:hypothetical protein